jgi:hypothetical protein
MGGLSGGAMVMTAVALYSKYPPTEGNHNASQNQVDVEKNIRC